MAPVPPFPPAPTENASGLPQLIQHLKDLVHSPYLFWALCGLLVLFVLLLLGGLALCLVRRVKAHKSKNASLLPTTVTDPHALRPLILPNVVAQTSYKAAIAADEKMSPKADSVSEKATKIETPQVAETSGKVACSSNTIALLPKVFGQAVREKVRDVQQSMHHRQDRWLYQYERRQEKREDKVSIGF